MSRILVIEDDTTLREELMEMLNNEGYETQTITEYVDTAKQIVASNADLVLLDINIPGLNGELVLRQLRKESDIPVIMVTSRTSESDEVLSMSYGADDYITKPYNPTILMLRISAVLKRTEQINRERDREQAADGRSTSESDAAANGILMYRDAKVIPAKGSISLDDKEVILTKNEIDRKSVV